MKSTFCCLLIGLSLLLGQDIRAQQGTNRFVIEPTLPPQRELKLAMVKVSGMGPIIGNNIQLAYQDAIVDAQQGAVMRIAQRLLPIDQWDLMKTVLEKQLSPDASSFIASYEEIDRTNSDTYVSVKLRVHVRQDKIASRLEQIDELKTYLQKPPIGFYIVQPAPSPPSEGGARGGGGQKFSPCESAMIAAFTTANFTALSHSTIEKASHFTELMSRDALRQIGEELGMVLLIVGESEDSPIPPNPQLGESFVERLVILRLNVYYCPTGEIIDVWDGREQGIGISEAAAVADGHKRVGRKAAKDLIQNLYARWASAALALQTHPLVVTHTQYAQWVQLREQLERSLSFDTRLYQHPYDAQNASARAEIETREEIETLVGQLKQVVQALPFQADVSYRDGQITVKTYPTSTPSPAASQRERFHNEIRRALLIGISEYEDEKIQRLRYTLADVKGLDDVLRKHGALREIQILTDESPEKPKKANILLAVEQLSKTSQPQDTVLVYFSGHGLEEGGKYYLLPIDTQRKSLAETAIELKEFQDALQKINAKRLILLMDSCHSGGVTIGSKGVGLSDALSQSLERFARSEGRIIFTSCKSNELSYEDPKKRHGVFTSYLLEALGGAADNGDGFITFYEIAGYVTDNVMRWAEQNGRSQTPKTHISVEGNILLTQVSK